MRRCECCDDQQRQCCKNPPARGTFLSRSVCIHLNLLINRRGTWTVSHRGRWLELYGRDFSSSFRICEFSVESARECGAIVRNFARLPKERLRRLKVEKWRGKRIALGLRGLQRPLPVLANDLVAVVLICTGQKTTKSGTVSENRCVCHPIGTRESRNRNSRWRASLQRDSYREHVAGCKRRKSWLK